MDDFSKLQKINSVARELMKHGQASSMDEAMRLATQQVESGITIMPEAPSPETKAAEIPEPAESVELPESSSASTEEIINSVERIIGAQQTTVSRMTVTVNTQTRQIADLTAKMNMLITEMAGLKEDIKRFKENPVVQPPLPKKQAAEGQTQFKPGQEIPSNSVKPQPEQSSGHARTGSFKPEDVSIEKFFYYGK
ncbi:hypothetical protein KY363_00115 [Candidatus Woesearchaeota archaeon]|nr:hypothetical protein [Candidatus Woesearchaeota archaeon]